MTEVIVPLAQVIVSPEDVDELGWQDQALCAQTDPEAFFPEKGGSTREAKRICRSCEVRAECLEYALENDERFGIWGGMSERERRRLKRLAVLSPAAAAARAPDRLRLERGLGWWLDIIRSPC
jgi:WhiB family transcriptional regulator, redox-sensing transcriptional regulator